jgi:hypothetical protein
MPQPLRTSNADRQPQPWLIRRTFAAAAIVLGLVAATTGAQPASAASPYERGPNPTAASISATTGPFPTASVTVPRGNGFGGGVIYYPTDTSQGTFGAVAISPGLNGTWSGIAWLGPPVGIPRVRRVRDRNEQPQ